MAGWVFVGVCVAALAVPMVAASQPDPYAATPYRMTMDGRTVAGGAHVRVELAHGDVVDYRDGGAPITVRKIPGRRKYTAITLERGVTNDLDFSTWASGAANGVAPRRSLTLQLTDRAGQPVQRYRFSNCWPTRFQALPKLNANANAVAIQHIKLECEGLLAPPPPKP
jgi:phage tail-like protein